MLPRYSSWLGRGTRPPYFPLLDALETRSPRPRRFASHLIWTPISYPDPPLYTRPLVVTGGFILPEKNDSTPSCRIYIADAQARDEICTCIVQSAMRRS